MDQFIRLNIWKIDLIKQAITILVNIDTSYSIKFTALSLIEWDKLIKHQSNASFDTQAVYVATWTSLPLGRYCCLKIFQIIFDTIRTYKF